MIETMKSQQSEALSYQRSTDTFIFNNIRDSNLNSNITLNYNKKPEDEEGEEMKESLSRSRNILSDSIIHLISNTKPSEINLYEKLFFKNDIDNEKNSTSHEMLKFLEILIEKNFIYKNIKILKELLSIFDPNTLNERVLNERQVIIGFCMLILSVQEAIKTVKIESENQMGDLAPMTLTCMYINLSTLILILNDYLNQKVGDEGGKLNTLKKQVISEYNVC